VVSFFTKKCLHLKLTVEVILKLQGPRVPLEKRMKNEKDEKV
jgi:hypothetical protein